MEQLFQGSTAVTQTPGSLSPAPPDPLGSVPYFGDYELLQKIAQGGMGVVYKARQVTLNRLVAVKLILAGHLATDSEIKRFYLEAEAIANLDHPNIVPIYEVGNHNGQHYFSMKLVEGENLAQRLAQCKSPIPHRQSASWMVQISRAVHYAHQRGILHRDLKPGNVLLDSQDIPHVADFGLAKHIVGPQATSELHTIAGTPNYMAPEQATGIGPLTTSADIYSLGVILYQLLTNRSPFSAATPQEVIQKTRQQTPSPPRQIDPSIDRDLECICLRCLEKEPANRYGSAEALAHELERWLNHEPILARPINPLERIAKWSRRRPDLAIMSLALTAAAVLGLAGVLWQWQSAETARRLAETEAFNARENLYQADMNLAQQAFDASNLGRAQSLLARHQPAPGQKDLRNFEWRFWWDRCRSDELSTLAHHSNIVSAVAFSSDSQIMATASHDRSIQLWDPATWKSTGTLPHPDAIRSIDFSPDGRYLAAGCLSGSVFLWDLAARKVLREFPCPQYSHGGAARFSPDATTLAVGDMYGLLTLWNVKSTQTIHSVRAHSRAITALAYSSDGKRLASASWDRSACIWEADSLRPLYRLTGHSDGVLCLAFSSDDQHLATGSRDNSIRIWKSSTGELSNTLNPHSAWISQLVFLPDNTTLLSASADQKIKVLNWHTGLETTTLSGHLGEVWALALSPNRQWLISGGKDYSVRAWPAQPKPKPPNHRPLSSRSDYGFSISDDASTFVAWNEQGSTLVWNADTLEEIAKLPIPATGVACGAVSPTGHLLASAGADGVVKLWNSTSQKPFAEFSTGTHSIHELKFSRNGSQLAAVNTDQTIGIWNIATQQPGPSFPGPSKTVLNLCFSPDDSLLAVASLDWTTTLYDLPNQRIRAVLREHAGEVFGLAFSPDGKTLATASWDGSVKIWDATLGKSILTLKGQALSAHSVAFSPDGQRLATGTGAGLIKLWNLATAQEVSTLTGHRGFVTRLAFSPNGDRLVSASGDAVLVWRAPK